MTAFRRQGQPASALADRVASGVKSGEFERLLGYPRDRALEGELLALADASREWYRDHGHPWVWTREVAILSLGEAEIELEDGTLVSSVLASRLRGASAVALTVAAVSAGPEVDERSERLWAEDRPDEAFFLDRFGAAVVERLAADCGEAITEAREPGALTALPGYSPGYEGWDLAQQKEVHALLVRGQDRPPGPLEVLDSGMIRPKNSLLSVFGMTRDIEMASRARERGRCSWCSLADCGFRHLPDGVGRAIQATTTEGGSG